MFEEVCEEERDARQPLDRSDHQLGQRLAGALGPPLAFLQEGVEPGRAPVTLYDLVLRLLEEVDEGWVGLQQVIRKLQDNPSNDSFLGPLRLGFN